VVETDGVEVTYQMMDTQGGGLDSNDEGEVGSEEEVVDTIDNGDRRVGTGCNQ
jgi:hypothetical protein